MIEVNKLQQLAETLDAINTKIATIDDLIAGHEVVLQNLNSEKKLLRVSHLAAKRELLTYLAPGTKFDELERLGS